MLLAAMVAFVAATAPASEAIEDIENQQTIICEDPEDAVVIFEDESEYSPSEDSEEFVYEDSEDEAEDAVAAFKED